MSDIYVVRQPIFDRSNKTVGFELRFREDEGDGDPFARAYLSGAIDTMRQGLPAYVRASRRQLLEGIFAITDPRTLVLLVPREVAPEEDVLDAIGTLAKSGMMIGIDDFELPKDASSGIITLLGHAKLVRLDLRGQSPSATGPLVAGLKRQGKIVVADHVLDAEQFSTCNSLGFDRFLGPHFSRPEPMPASEIPTSTGTALRVLGLARDPDTSERELEQVIASDPGITYQLLRIVNSAAIGGKGITSIAHALRLVGRSNVIRWLSLASVASRMGKSGVDDELIRQAIHRARFCELLITPGSRRDRGTLFLVGLFSLLDSVFRMPIADVVERVSLTDEARAALLNREGVYAEPLFCAESYELGLWEGAADAARKMGVSPDLLPGLYNEAFLWAQEQMPTTKARVPARV
jgi:EAL and modified HD-GYP domain-containing signal transduction protein